MAGAGYSRRTLLAGAAAALPFAVKASDKAGTKPVIVGEGEHRYECIHDWGEVPKQIMYGNTHGVCEDSQGRIYIHHTVNAQSPAADTIVVFDEKGKFVRSWGKQFKGGAHGLMIHKEGRDEYLYLCDHTHGLVTKRTLKGEEVFTLGFPAESEAYKPTTVPAPAGSSNATPAAPPQRLFKSYQPTNVAIAPNGDLYVGDGYGSSFINQYNAKGEFIRTFGGLGKEAGQINCPHGLWVDLRGATPNLTVADRGNNRLQRFTLDGKHIDFVQETSRMPCNFGERNGDVVIPDLLASVNVIDKNNKLVVRLGAPADPANVRSLVALRTKPREAFPQGQFICPHGACFDHAGNIFVVEWVEVGRVTKLRKVS